MFRLSPVSSSKPKIRFKSMHNIGFWRRYNAEWPLTSASVESSVQPPCSGWGSDSDLESVPGVFDGDGEGNQSIRSKHPRTWREHTNSAERTRGGIQTQDLCDVRWQCYPKWNRFRPPGLVRNEGTHKILLWRSSSFKWSYNVDTCASSAQPGQTSHFAHGTASSLNLVL